jgi:hypothetical protein
MHAATTITCGWSPLSSGCIAFVADVARTLTTIHQARGKRSGCEVQEATGSKHPCWQVAASHPKYSLNTIECSSLMAVSVTTTTCSLCIFLCDRDAQNLR